MTSSTVSANSATGQGGGINAGTLTMTGSTVSGNGSLGQGAGIFATAATVTTSTVNQTRAATRAGASS